MPPSWHAGTWLLYFLIQVNYLIAFVFNLALGNPVSRDDDSICISCLSGKMTFHYVEQDSYTLMMSLVGGAFTYYLTMVLRTTPLKPWERSTSQEEVSVPQVESFTSSIPPLPVHTPDNTQIVPPSVPFRVPCPHCQNPLEVGEYCRLHCEEGITVLRQGPEAPLEEHHRVPFLFLPVGRLARPFERNSDSTRATCTTSPASLTSPVEALIPISQHAHSEPSCFCLPANIPARQLRCRALLSSRLGSQLSEAS